MGAHELRLSEGALAHLRAVRVAPGLPAGQGSSAAAIAFEQALFDATGRRGLPLLAGFSFGVSGARETSILTSPLGAPVAWHPRSGTIYLADSGELYTSGLKTRRLGTSPTHLVEHLIQLDQIRSTGFVLHALGDHGAALAGAIGASAMPAWPAAWISPRGTILEVWSGLTRVFATDADEVAALLVQAARSRLRVGFEETEGPDACDSTVPDGPRIYTFTSAGPSPGGALSIGRLDEGGFFEVRSAGDVLNEVRLYSPGKSAVPASGLPGSPRLQRYFASRRARRVPARRDPAAFERWLSSHPDLGALCAVEEAWGGLASLGPWGGEGPLWLGPWMAVMRRGALAEQGRGASDDAPGNTETLPAITLQGRRFLLAGGDAPDHDLCLDPAGRVYRYLPDSEDLTLLAGSVSVMFERSALMACFAEAGWGQSAPLTIDRDLGATLADALGATSIPEASDETGTHWIGDRVWIRAHAQGTSLVAARLADFERAAALVRRVAPGAGLSVSAGGLGAPERIAAISPKTGA